MRRAPWALPSVVAAALLAAGLPGRAQPAAATPHAIKAGFDAAWTRQPEQRAAALRRDAAQAGLQAAERWTPEPAALELTARSDRYARNQGGREVEATVAIPLWLPGEKSGGRAAAAAEAAAVEARLEAARWRVAAEVREAYWAHERARLEQALARERLDNARGLADDVERRTRAGELARSDGHQARAAAAAAEAALAEAGVAVSQAALRWAGLTGQRPPDGPEPLRPEPMPAERPTPPHPALRALQAGVELARRQRELAGVQQRANPELTLGAVRERGEYGERYAQGLVIGLRLPLGRHGLAPSRLAAAGAEQAEAEASLDLEQARLQADAAAAKEREQALAAAAEAAQRRAALAAESRGFFDKSFRLGESDLPTRLRVDLEAFEAERQAARSRLEHAAAISQLRQSLGLLPE